MIIQDKDGRFISFDLQMAAAAKFVDRLTEWHATGYNPSLSSSQQTIWEPGGLYPWDAFPTTPTIESDSENDVGVLVATYALDAGGFKKTIVTALDGLTPVPFGEEILRVNQMVVVSPGGAEGNIVLKAGETVISQITEGFNRTLQGVYTVPADYIGLFTYGDFGVGKGRDALGLPFVRPPGGCFFIVYPIEVYQTSKNRPFHAAHHLESLTDIDFRALTEGGEPVAASCSYDIILIRKK